MIYLNSYTSASEADGTTALTPYVGVVSDSGDTTTLFASTTESAEVKISAVTSVPKGKAYVSLKTPSYVYYADGTTKKVYGEIADWGFSVSGDTTITSITLNSTVTFIPENAFNGCTGLANITIGKTVTSIGTSAFTDCTSVSSFSYNGTIKEWKKITKLSDWHKNVPTDTMAKCSDGLTYLEVGYLKFTALENNSTVTLDSYSGSSIVSFANTGMTLYYSTDDETYTQWTGQTITLNNGEFIYVYGENPTTWVTNSTYPHFSMSGKISASGNIQSMISKVMSDTIPFDFCYNNMFGGCTSLTTAPELPATTLAYCCYYQMFSGCTSLVTAPELPATTLTGYCYTYMFYGCTSLVNASELPATTLAQYCYQSMFRGCTSLTTAPELHSTSLAQYCYSSMFNKCTSLVTAPALPATTLANDCYHGMFADCTGLVTAPALPATTLANDCYSSMFNKCTSLVTAPALPATTLANDCYYGMFADCAGLVTAPVLPATTLEYRCYEHMFYGCTSLTTAPELPATKLASKCYDGMFYGCTSLNYIKALFTTTPSTSYTSDWVTKVASSGTFVKNSAATWNVKGVNGIPNNWTVETVDA